MIRRLRRLLLWKSRQILIIFILLIVLATAQWAFFRAHTLYDYISSVCNMALIFLLFGIFGVALGSIAVSDYIEEIKSHLEAEGELEEGYKPRVPETRIDIFYGLLIVGIPTFLITLLISLLMLS